MTRAAQIPAGERSAARTGRAAVIIGVATLVDYLGWLAWDQHKDVHPDHVSGPYQPWQVIGLVLVLILIAAIAGRRRYPWAATVVLPLVMTVCFSVDAATDADS